MGDRRLSQDRSVATSTGVLLALLASTAWSETDSGSLLGIVGSDTRGIVGGDTRGIVGGDTRGIIGGDARGIIGSDADGIVGSDSRGIIGSDADGIVGGDSRGIIGSDADGIVGGDARGIVGSDADGIVGGDSRGIVGSDADGIVGGDSRGNTGSDLSLLVVGRVENVAYDFVSVLGQSIFASSGDMAGVGVGATVAVYGRLDPQLGGIVDARLVPVAAPGVDAGPSLLTGFVDEVDPTIGRAVVGGVSVDYNARLAGGDAPEVGDIVSISGRRYAGLGVLVAE